MTTTATQFSDVDNDQSESATSDKRLEDRTVKELRELASQLGIRGRSKLMHKDELIHVIRRRW
ncbi:Rho termination factor N-terminal domain-containing protein [Bremerella sp. JC770]|uniref:Rho termination factor N-terminal domain-containing protein n=1 Tax=Bremerella sp. JC770 TaxID=3232137 RepID=UPI0034583B1F